MPRYYVEWTTVQEWTATVTAENADAARRMVENGDVDGHAPDGADIVDVTASCDLCHGEGLIPAIGAPRGAIDCPECTPQSAPEPHPLARAMRPTCAECGRTFDMSDATDADEWAYGHDCEV